MGLIKGNFSLKEFLKNAFKVEKDNLTDEDKKILDKIADNIARRKLIPVAIILLETGAPFNFLVSQFLFGLSPFLSPLERDTQTKRLAELLEKRESVQYLISLLESKSDGKNIS